MSYAIFGLIFVLLIVFGVMSSKQWHWLNIVFLILTYVAGVAACAGMAKALKLRQRDMSDAFKQEALAEKYETDASLAISGSPNSITYDANSLRGLNEQLNQEMLGRGRVWPRGNVTVSEKTPENRVFNFSAERDGDNGPQNQMTGMVLYIFADGVIDDQDYPVYYIGTARVVSETPKQIELEPVFIVNKPAYATPAATWSLFEKMPIDRRDAFKKRANLMGDDFDLTKYREALETQFLPAEMFGLDPNSEAYERLIDRYAFDGLKLGEIANSILAAPNRKSARFEPPPEEVFVEYRFNEKTEAEFEVDAGENATIDTSGAFQNGRAVDPSLKAGKKISFAKDDTVLIDQLTADGFQRADGQTVAPFAQRYPVTEVDRYFFREVRDYPYILSDLQRQSQRFVEELARVKSNIAETQIALDDATGQVALRDDTITKLLQDQGNLKNDLGVITSLRDQRESQLAQLEQRGLQLQQQIEKQYRLLKDAAPTP
jgi:hypothetical protein